MFNTDANIIKLNCVRKHQIVEEIRIAMGEEEYNYYFSASTICNFICTSLCGSKASVNCYEVDMLKITAEKEKHNKLSKSG